MDRKTYQLKAPFTGWAPDVSYLDTTPSTVVDGRNVWLDNGLLRPCYGLTQRTLSGHVLWVGPTVGGVWGECAITGTGSSGKFYYNGAEQTIGGGVTFNPGTWSGGVPIKLPSACWVNVAGVPWLVICQNNGTAGLLVWKGSGNSVVALGGAPALVYQAVSAHNYRLVAASGSLVYWSNSGTPENWDSSALIPASSNGDTVYALHNLGHVFLAVSSSEVTVLWDQANANGITLERRFMSGGVLSPQAVCGDGSRAFLWLTTGELATCDGGGLQVIPMTGNRRIWLQHYNATFPQCQTWSLAYDPFAETVWIAPGRRLYLNTATRLFGFSLQSARRTPVLNDIPSRAVGEMHPPLLCDDSASGASAAYFTCVGMREGPQHFRQTGMVAGVSNGKLIAKYAGATTDAEQVSRVWLPPLDLGLPIQRKVVYAVRLQTDDYQGSEANRTFTVYVRPSAYTEHFDSGDSYGEPPAVTGLSSATFAAESRGWNPLVDGSGNPAPVSGRYVQPIVQFNSALDNMAMFSGLDLQFTIAGEV